MIKKRTPQVGTTATEEQIEAFAAGANAGRLPATTSPVSAPASEPTQSRVAKQAAAQMLLKFEKNMDLSQQLANVANKLDRSKHWVALQALSIGLAELDKRDS